MQSNLTKSFPLFLRVRGRTRTCARVCLCVCIHGALEEDGETDRKRAKRKGAGQERTGWEKPYVKIRLEKLYEGQL